MTQLPMGIPAPEPHPSKSGPPSWLVPVGIGVVVVLLVGVLALVLARGPNSTAQTVGATGATPPATGATPPATGAPGADRSERTASSDDESETNRNDSDPTTTTPNEPSAGSASSETVNAPTCSDYRNNDQLPLRRCDSGDFVVSAQQALVNFGIAIDTDGYFGPGTDAAVRDFQTQIGLSVDGVIGDMTWDALCPYSNTLCEPDGGDPTPAGISIDGQQQSVLYECTHFPFQNQDGIADGHVSGDLYLVDDPVTGARRVVEIWIEDDTRVLVVSSIAQATVGQVEIPFAEPVFQAVNVAGTELVVTADIAPPTIRCDTMFAAGPDGAFIAYGVTDVCSAGRDRVITLNTWWGPDFDHRYSEMVLALDSDDPVSGGATDPQLRLAGEYVDVRGLERGVSASNEFFTGTFELDGQPWMVDLAIDSYPEGGHGCVAGQITD